MKLEKRQTGGVPAIILIAENDDESKLIGEMLGDIVQDGSGLIAKVEGEVRLSDGFYEHYIYLKKKE